MFGFHTFTVRELLIPTVIFPFVAAIVLALWLIMEHFGVW